MIFRLTMFVVFGLDNDLDQYAVIHYGGSVSHRMYSKTACRKMAELLSSSQSPVGRVSKEELMAIEDAVSNSRLGDEICPKDMLEMSRTANKILKQYANIINAVLVEAAGETADQPGGSAKFH